MSLDSDNYINKLPDELIVCILLNLKTFDMINFSKAYPSLNYILYDIKLIRSIDFYKAYELDLQDFQSFFSRKAKFLTAVKHLNITSVYWIPALNLRNCIAKMPNLECLFAIDTKLEFTMEECEIYQNSSKLKKLALSINSNVDAKLSYVRHVDYLYFVVNDSLMTNSFVMSRFKKYWVIYEAAALPRLFDVMNTANLKENPFRTHILLGSPNRIHDGYIHYNELMRIFLSKYNGPNQQIWKTENETVMYQMSPFGVADIQDLISERYHLDSINFKELNLHHSQLICNKHCAKFVSDVLLSPNVKYLRKLAVNYCVWQIHEYNRNNDIEPTLKKTKIETFTQADTFQKILENCSLLEEIEMWRCDCALDVIQFQQFDCIINLKHLKKLSLDQLPMQINGRFLIELFKNCTYLEGLFINCKSQNTSINNHLCLALPYAKSLKDLRYEQRYIPLDRIFESLRDMKSEQFQRLYIKTDNIEKFSAKPLQEFLEKHVTLIFLLIVIKNLPREAHRKIQNALKSYKKRPQQVFLTTKDESSFTGNFPIPSIHKKEIIDPYSKIAVYNYFENCDI